MQEGVQLIQKYNNKNKKMIQIQKMKNKINLQSSWNNIYKNHKKKHFKNYHKISSKFLKSSQAILKNKWMNSNY